MPNIELRDYQKIGVDFLTKRRSAGLFDDMGTGKSRQALAVVNNIESNNNLIIAPKIVAKHWAREIEKVFGPTYTTFITDNALSQELFNTGNNGVFVVLGSKKERENALLLYKLYRLKFPNNKSFLITNYHNQDTILSNFPNWELRILDECHAIKNHDTDFWRTTKKFNILRDYLLTGTPMSQGPKDLWAYLNIISPDEWSGYWPYVRKYLVYDQSTNYGTFIGGPKNPKMLRDALNNFIIRRLKKDVLPQLTKSRIRYDVIPNSKQQKIYKELVEDMMSLTDSGDLLLIDNAAVRTVRLRQLLVAPQILGYNFSSATLEATNEIVTSCGTPSAIFTTFREAFPFIKKTIPKSWEVYEIAGGMIYEKLDEVVQAYERSATDKKTIIATTQMSQGFELLCASNAIFAGPDWNPIFDGQSEDRLSRLGNTNHITCHYIINEGTVEEGIIKRVAEKMEWASQSIRADTRSLYSWEYS